MHTFSMAIIVLNKRSHPILNRAQPHWRPIMSIYIAKNILNIILHWNRISNFCQNQSNNTWQFYEWWLMSDACRHNIFLSDKMDLPLKISYALHVRSMARFKWPDNGFWSICINELDSNQLLKDKKKKINKQQILPFPLTTKARIQAKIMNFLHSIDGHFVWAFLWNAFVFHVFNSFAERERKKYMNN